MPSAPCLHSLVRSQVTPSPPPRLIGAGLAAASVAQSLLEVYAATTASTPRIAPADMRDQERRQGRHDQRAAADVAPWATATSLCILSLFLGAIADANAASTIKITCNGSLTNTRADGVTLGQCDLNFISVKQMDEIQTVCGIPGTVDTPAENQCRIRAVVSPDPIATADHRKLYKVLELWSVDKR